VSGVRQRVSVFTGTWSLLSLATLAFLMSVLFENPIVASFTALTLYVMLNVIGRVDFFVDLRPYLFTTDMEFWRDVLKPEVPWQDFYHYTATCGAYIFGLLLLSVLIFERRDIIS